MQGSAGSMGVEGITTGSAGSLADEGFENSVEVDYLKVEGAISMIGLGGSQCHTHGVSKPNQQI